MVYYSHALSSPEIIFEYVTMSNTLFYYYRIYSSKIGSQNAYAFIYHPFHGAFLVKEYDELRNDFENEVSKLIPYDESDAEEEDEENDFSNSDSESSEEDSEEDTEEDTEEEANFMPSALTPFLRSFNDSHYKLALSDILKVYYLSQDYQMDFNHFSHTYNYQCYHFYGNLYITNLLTKYNDCGEASSAHFLIKINDETFQLDYFANDEISVHFAPVVIRI